MDTINTTTLARSFHVTTKDVLRILSEAGIKPTATVDMGSRSFRVWPRDQAMAVLEARRKASKTAQERRIDTGEGVGTLEARLERLEAAIESQREILSAILAVLKH